VTCFVLEIYNVGKVSSSHSCTLTSFCRVSVNVKSPEIAWASLHVAIPWYFHIYTIPFLLLYPLLAYAYYIKYDDWIKSEEWTFLACVSLGAGHALSFLVTRWSTAAKARITTLNVRFTHCAVRVFPSYLYLGEHPLRCRLYTDSTCSSSW
jgi:hypothetical protein